VWATRSNIETQQCMEQHHLPYLAVVEVIGRNELNGKDENKQKKRKRERDNKKETVTAETMILQ